MIDGLKFLLEIGTEEIPDWMIEPALDGMRERFTALLKEQRLDGQVEWVEATPRRLVLLASGLRQAQEDEVRSVSGPPVSSGQGAAAGFAKKMGVTVDQLTQVETSKGSYFSYEKKVEGRRSLDLLTELLPTFVAGTSFPKAMYWTGKSGTRFIRPIRWMVALLGADVVPFEVAGVRSGNATSGHRILGKPSAEVTIESYEQVLRDNGVLLRADERRARIQAALAEDVSPDDALLTTLVYLTEFPTPIRGSFDREFLQLPQEVLTTVMRHHQRYFAVRNPDGSLKPEFVAVMNTSGDPDGLVRHGNERVLRARFNDARFFWSVDVQRPLADRLEDLRNVTFQAQLGSYHGKVERTVGLVRNIAASAGANDQFAVRAAQLAKCDLTTEMVKEFTELQGVMGGLYARASGEPEEVWRAVYEHYKPAAMDDAIPSTPTGQGVALADKADTLRGCFEVGLMPTGSRDPFALRRAAQGVVRILVEAGIRLRVSELLGSHEQLSEFMLDRARYYFRDVRGFRYDEVNAVLAVQREDLKDALMRLEALRAVRPTADFEPLAASFKRIQNILRKESFTGDVEVDASLLTEEAERELSAAMASVKLDEGATYSEALTRIASLRPAIDKFFDKVLVNAPDERIRRNRLALLSSLITEFSTIADFSEIVVTTQ
ncbi:MAG TPA: glycine--tRNA ligase subunit beta [Bryobacteraceae bacterium]|nr:glycine--tRNA ligase subunit beta [Bryobacteraceae bacterium]